MTTTQPPPLPEELATRPPVHREEAPGGPGWRARAWDRLCRWALTVPFPRRHRHFYQLIGAYAHDPGPSPMWMLAGNRPQPATVLALRCMCHRADQLQFQTAPGLWSLDDLTTPDWPALISVARAQYAGELAAVRRRFGDQAAGELLDPPGPDWRYVAGQLADAERDGSPSARRAAADLYQRACQAAAGAVPEAGIVEEPQ